MLNFADPDEIAAETPNLIDELIGAVAAGDVKQRLRVLQRVTDLFLAGSRGFSGEQIGLFDDVLQQLAADIEVKARARLSSRLAGVERAPPQLVRALAFDDEIEVAGPVLTHAPQLSDADLAENARGKSQRHLYAIAQRLKLSETVTDVLVERGNDRVVRKVARNTGARFSLAGYDKLTVRAQRDRRLTLILGQRSDLPRQYFLKLLENASASVRARLEAANPQAAAAVRAAVDDVATAMQREAREDSHEYSAAARSAKHRFRRHPVNEADVHAPAHAQEFEKTAVALAKLGCFPIDLVERALARRGRGHDPGARQGRRLFLEHGPRAPADVCCPAPPAAGRARPGLRALQEARPGDFPQRHRLLQEAHGAARARRPISRAQSSSSAAPR